jgi:hypothetical protein
MDGAYSDNDYEKGKLGFDDWFLVRDSVLTHVSIARNTLHQTLYQYDWYY